VARHHVSRTFRRARVRGGLAGLLVAVVTTLATAGSARPAASPDYPGPALVGFTGTVSFSAGRGGTRGVAGCPEPNEFGVAGDASSQLSALTATTQSGAPGWSLSVDGADLINHVDLYWLQQSQIGDTTAVSAFDLDATMTQAVAASGSPQQWQLKVLPATTGCPVQMTQQQSPIGMAYPMQWSLTDGRNANGGLGCGYVAVTGDPPTGPTTYAEQFLITDSLSEVDRDRQSQWECNQGKAIVTKARYTCVVPPVVGTAKKAAVRTARAAGCPLAPIAFAYSAHAPKGRVVSQTPKAGTQIGAPGQQARGQAAVLTLTVSKGKPPAKRARPKRPKRNR
jgi:PASTA domain